MKLRSLFLIFVATCTSAIIARADEPQHFKENNLELSLESGYLSSVNNPVHYHMAPQILSLHWQLDNVGNNGWLRGNTEWIVGGYFTPVLEGAENRFSGMLFGPRYNFVQPNWKFVPYIESRVGFAFTDSGTVSGAQGQDFCFTFVTATGVRYLIDDNWSISLAAMYQHISNGGLSEPQRPNNGLDSIGPQLGVLYKF